MKLPCQKCRIGGLTLIPETLKDEPINICDNCGSKFKLIMNEEETEIIYVEIFD